MNGGPVKRSAVVGATFREALRSVAASNVALIVAYMAQVLYGATLGGSAQLDIYFATNGVANGMLALLGGAMISSVAAKLMRSEESATRLGWGFALLSSGLIVAMAVLLALLASPILQWLVPAHYATHPELGHQLMLINLLAGVLNGIGLSMYSLLYSRGAMISTGMSLALVSMGGVAGLIIAPEGGATSIAWGTAAGALLRIVLLGVIAVTRLGFRLTTDVASVKQGAATYTVNLTLLLPGLGMAAVAAVDKHFVATEPTGTVTALVYGLLVLNASAAVIGGGLYPVASRAVGAMTDPSKVRQKTLQMLAKAFAYGTPAVLVIVVGREYLASILLGYGNIDAQILRDVSSVILWGSAALLTAMTGIASGSYVTTATPLRYGLLGIVGLASFALVIVVGTAISPLERVAAAYSAMYLTSGIVYVIACLGAPVRGSILASRLWSMFKFLVRSVTAVLASVAALAALPWFPGDSHLGDAAVLAVIAIVSVLATLAVWAIFTGVERLASLRR